MSNPEWWRKPRAPFTRGVIADALAHANAEAPREAVGLVVRGSYRPCVNISTDPENAFAVHRDDYLRAEAEGGVEGVVHSHPGGPYWPSAADMEHQISSDVPWAIVIPGAPGEFACAWGGERPPLRYEDGRLRPRAFLHGVSDCYTLIRDFYLERGVELPEFARDWEWWRDGADLYLEGFAVAGFELVSADALAIRAGEIVEVGDVILRAIRSDRPNHACVYDGGSICLEHHHGRLAARTPYRVATLGATHLLRHRSWRA